MSTYPQIAPSTSSGSVRVPHASEDLAPELGPEAEEERFTDRVNAVQVPPGRFVGPSIVGLFVIAVFAVLFFARPVFFPLVFAIFLNLLLSPAVRALRRMRIPTPVAAFLVLGSSMAVVVWAVVLLSEPAAAWWSRAPSTIENLERKLQFLKKPIQQFSEAEAKLEAATAGTAQRKLVTVQVQDGSVAGSLVTVTGQVVGELMVALVLAYFLLAAGDRFLLKSVELLPTLQDKKKIVEVMRSIEGSISAYLASTALINTTLGTVQAIAMWMLGMPNPILWGVMCAFLNFIPYIGGLVGVVVITLVAFMTYSEPLWAIIVPVVYYALDTFEGSVVTPWVLGRRLDLNPPVILTWILLWGWLWGVFGVLLAVPMLAALKIVFESIETLSPLGKYLTR